jgi:hypothetical protein
VMIRPPIAHRTGAAGRPSGPRGPVRRLAPACPDRPVSLPPGTVHPPPQARTGTPWGWWRCVLLALPAIALPLQSTAIALNRLAPAHVHAPTPPSGELDPAPRAAGHIGHAHDHEQTHAHSGDAVRSEAMHHARHGHVAHHLHAHDDLSVVAMSEAALDDDPLAPGKRALVDQDPIAGLAAWLPAPHARMRPLGAKPRRYFSHVCPPPERPPR